MSTAKRTITVKDAATFTLHEADLTGMEVREKLETPKRDIPCSGGLQWWIRWFPAGETEVRNGHVSAFLWVNKPVSAKYTFDVHGSSISKTVTHDYSNSPNGYGWPKLATHAELRPFFTNGKLTITCNVEFDFPVQSFPGVCAFQLFEHVPTDVEFVFGSDRVPAHKSFLALISPVFQKMFSRNKANSKSGRVEVTEFKFDTVKAAIDFCYGRQLTELSVEIVVYILRFADKYRITAVINDLLKLPFLNLTTCNFCLIVSYAYDCNKYSLLAKCYNFFKNHQDEIKAITQFPELPLALVVHVLKSAFGFKTDFDVLRHAHKNGMEFVMTHLETPLLDSLTLDNFFDTVNYAWDCSRDELKQACAKFLNNNREVWNLKAFNDLPYDVVGELMRARYVLDHGDD